MNKYKKLFGLFYDIVLPKIDLGFIVEKKAFDFDLLKRAVLEMLATIDIPNISVKSLEELFAILVNIEVAYYNKEDNILRFSDEDEINFNDSSIKVTYEQLKKDVENLITKGKTIEYLPYNIQKSLERVYYFLNTVISQTTLKDTLGLIEEENGNIGLVLLSHCMFYDLNSRLRCVAAGSPITYELYSLLKDNNIDLDSYEYGDIITIIDGNGKEVDLALSDVLYYVESCSEYLHPSTVINLAYDPYDDTNVPDNLCFAFNFDNAPSLFAFIDEPTINKNSFTVIDIFRGY